MSNTIRSQFQAHPFHLVNQSPWPLFMSGILLSLTTTGVLCMHGFNQASTIFFLSLICLVSTMALWFRDVIAESTYLGHHTLAVQKGINLGVGLFIISEALFFLAIFWAFFHSALSPNIEIGTLWPPLGTLAINPKELPLLNTILLLCSGITVTYAHHSLIEGNRLGTLYGLLGTIFLALIFTYLQWTEYIVSFFTFADSVYGSCFYFGTGFHGLHVIVGTLFIGTGLWRNTAYHLTENHHLGFESAILYWHFVDVVWLILYVSVYYWGS